MKSPKIVLMAITLAGVLSACNNGGNSTPVTTPTTPVVDYLVSAPGCMVGGTYHDREDMCRQLVQDGRLANCSRQDRYDFFNKKCIDHREWWQNPPQDGDGRGGRGDGRDNNGRGDNGGRHIDSQDSN